MTRVAIITRTKNRPLMLPRARRSIEQQSFREFVWVIVNDAGTKQYVEENANIARDNGVEVKVVHRQESIGMEAASNAGVRAVDTEFVVIHDDDDTWQPGFLERTVVFLDEHPEFVGVVCTSQAIYERVTDEQVVETGRMPYNKSLDSIQFADMAQENLYAPISFLFRRTVYDLVGGYDESLPVLGDWDFNLRVLLHGDIGLLPEMLANYHIRDTATSDFTPYGNSITAGVNLHVIHDARYRNRKLREDLENGQIGLGLLLFHGRQSLRIQKNVGFIYRLVSLPKVVWTKLKRRIRQGPRNQ